MIFNTDGFNERINYINNSNDLNRLKNNPNNFDNSFAQMRVDVRRKLVNTTNQDKVLVTEEIRENKDNFLIRNNNMNRVNNKPNSVSDSLNKNIFKR